MLDYENDITIDPDALDVEWLRQADLMRRYSMHAAETRRLMDEAKERLDFVRSKLDSQIRSNPELYGISKVTESSIQAAIVLSAEYQEASREYIQAKYEYEATNAAVRALDQKRSALENLVKLLGLSYFAGPAVPRDLHAEYEKRNAMVNRKVRLTRRGEA